MKGANKAIIVGTLGKDPELRYTGGGTAVASLSVATSESWTDKATGQKQEETQWHRITIYGKLAEIAGQYLKKGSKAFFSGTINYRKYQDKQTGQDKYITEIKASEMQMLDGRGDSQQAAPAPAAHPSSGYAAPAQGKDDFEDDILF